ncbi:MAG: NAD(P)/FAD-dependent oxidoreductase [Asticcacaulis sp.]
MSEVNYEIVVLGAGAAGLMCAIEAGRRGKSVIVLDHAKKPAEKIRISGGGKCNFTHLQAEPKNFLSGNAHFCISALKRFTPWDFLDRVKAFGIPYFEKTEGQLFCEDSAGDIIDMLLNDLHQAGGDLELDIAIEGVIKTETGFEVKTSQGFISCHKVVVATGGLSIPKMGATGLAYEIARQFGHVITETRAGLVPFTLGGEKLTAIEGLSGVSLPAKVTCGTVSFSDGFLFTHRGLSGPAVLQISSYWKPGLNIEVNLRPDIDMLAHLQAKRKDRSKQLIATVMAEVLPRRLSDRLLEWHKVKPENRMAELSNATLQTLADAVNRWTFMPDGTEGYRTAEVTLGGIDTSGLSSQTMESLKCPGLYFIGECVDVTGWLGGYNFQWAWSSGWAAGQAV